MLRYDNIKKEEVEEGLENNNLDRCDVCKVMLTANQSCETESESQPTHRLTARRNPSRSAAKRNVLYRETDFEVDSPLYSIKQNCWKCSEVKTEPLKMEADTLTIDDQVEKASVIIKQKRTKCNVCDKTFSRRSALKLHIRTVHDKVRAFECPHCPYKATTNGSLKSHILTHTGEKNFKCDICDKTFSRRSGLKLHVRTVHDKVRAFECPHCLYKATTNDSLKNHILTHTGEKNFKCDICDNKFTRNRQLKLHIRTVHDKVRAFSCPHCPYKATTNDALKRHVLTHTGEKNFKCDICDKTFTLKSQLKLHIRTVHDKIRAFPCPHCPYKATANGNLKNHILTHTGDKNSKCDICDKKFARNAPLKRHRRTVHDKVRDFPCPHCPYKATTSGDLTRHILTHTGEKSFKCDICNKKFAQNCNLTRHIRTVHGILDDLTRFYNENQ